MNAKLSKTLATGLVALTILSSCATGNATTQTTAANAVVPTVSSALPAATATETAPTVEVRTATATAAPTNTAEPVVEAAATTVPVALAENKNANDKVDAVAGQSATTSITLNGDTISVDGSGVQVNGSTATITAAGEYTLNGTLNDGQIAVDTADTEPVVLILNGVTLASSTSAPINIIHAEEVEITLAAGTENRVSDASSYVYPDATTDEPNAAIFSKVDLIISGEGSLIVEGNANDGIASKDGLTIISGTITVTAADDGIRGKDYLLVRGGTVTVNAQGDGLKSDDEEDPAKGYVAVEGGVLNITTNGDAIQAQTDVLISGGEFTLNTGGGDASSAKGIKGTVNVTIDGGTFQITSADDAIHSNADVTINGGSFVITTGDDGIHGDATVTINNGDVTIAQSYEAIESAVITINNGTVVTYSNDDGINVVAATGEAGGGMGGGRPRGQRPGGMGGQEATTYTGSNYLYLNGGVVSVTAGGDGLDVNGAIEMTGGTVTVNGPTAQMNGAIDYDGIFRATGGTIVAAGSSGMAQAPGQVSTQPSVLVFFNGAVPAGTLVHVENSAGEEIFTFAPSKAFQTVAFSSAALQVGDTISIYLGGSSTGSAVNGLYSGGAYSGGQLYTTVTLSSIVTRI